MSEAVPLPGGVVTGPVRFGDTVIRSCTERCPTAEAALRPFEDADWSGAPRLLEVTAGGTQTLTFLPGDVPLSRPVPGWAATDRALTAVARLTREFHDLTAGTAPVGADEVLCHHDLAPNNTVYRAGVPYAFIDWDIAGPGTPVQDVAHICWQWLDLGPSVTDVAARRGGSP